MKFNPNDPVWVKSLGARVPDCIPAGEHAGVVVAWYESFQTIYGIPGYIVILCQDYARIACAEHRLRPRRDDYQQHEPLGSRADLDKPASSPDFKEHSISVEEALIELHKALLP